jgi:hypothetical protein
MHSTSFEVPLSNQSSTWIRTNVVLKNNDQNFKIVGFQQTL